MPQPPFRLPMPPFRPVVTYTVLGLTVLAYLAQIGSQIAFGYDVPAALGMKVNALIEQGEYWRLFTPMLLHGGLLHIGFNMYALSAIGPELERFFGRARFFLLYLLGGFAGNVLSMAFTEANSLGASTAIFGLLAAQGVFIYQNQALFGPRGRAILNRVLQLAVINLIIGLQAGIDNWGHVGGLIGGLAYTWFAGPRLAWQGLFPDGRLVDQRPVETWLLAAAGIALLIAAAAGAVIFTR